MTDRRCPVCGESLDHRDPAAVTCCPAHRRELSRIRRLLSGENDGPYTSLGQYTSRVRKPRANRREAA